MSSDSQLPSKENNIVSMEKKKSRLMDKKRQRVRERDRVCV